MLRQLLDELKEVTLDEGSRDRMREIYDTSVQELGSALSPDLSDELNRITLPFGNDEIPSEAELRVAQAQLVGWLEGLIQGIQATLFAQQMAAQQQLANMRSGGALLAGSSGQTKTPRMLTGIQKIDLELICSYWRKSQTSTRKMNDRNVICR